ncbi:MAG: hypothetical protein ACI9YT_003104, partial [Halobacteriales archaeon]
MRRALNRAFVVSDAKLETWVLSHWRPPILTIA